MTPLYIFILAGGSGERFWPLSRKKTPKHLLRLLGKETLLEQTVRRFEKVVPQERLFILTNEAQLEATRAVLPHHPKENIIAEPAKRDTAPAAALATAWALRQDPEAIIGLFPADAMIHDIETFGQQLLEATSKTLESSSLLTFSVQPTHPSISFGYLDLSNSLPKKEKEMTTFHKVRSFVEKPPRAKAEEFCASGHYGWNAGMFLWKGNAFLKECERQQPLLASFLKKLVETSIPQEVIAHEFPLLPKISIDYAIMEHAEKVIAAKALFDWDDVGHWTALPKHLGVDEQGNTLTSPQKMILHDASNNIVVAHGKPIALCDVHDLVVVQTAEALLICHRDSVEKIKLLPLPEELR